MSELLMWVFLALGTLALAILIVEVKKESKDKIVEKTKGFVCKSDTPATSNNKEWLESTMATCVKCGFEYECSVDRRFEGGYCNGSERVKSIFHCPKCGSLDRQIGNTATKTVNFK